MIIDRGINQIFSCTNIIRNDGAYMRRRLLGGLSTVCNLIFTWYNTYGQTSNIERSQLPKLVYFTLRLVLQLSLPNPLKQWVKSRMKM